MNERLRERVAPAGASCTEDACAPGAASPPGAPPRAAPRRHVPAGLQERLGGREDLGQRGVAGDGHRVVEAELSPEPPTRNTRHVSDSGARTSLAVGVSGAPADDPGTTRGRLRAQTSPPKAQRHTQGGAVCRRARCSSRHALVSGQGQRSTQTPHGDPVQATVRKRHGARRRWTCRAPGSGLVPEFPPSPLAPCFDQPRTSLALSELSRVSSLTMSNFSFPSVAL